MRSAILPLFLLIVTGVFGQKTDDRVTAIDSFFTDAYNKGEWNGNVLIAEKGEVIYRKSFGWADRAKNIGLNDESIFDLASVSKQFTSMGIMILKKQGKLSYDDSLRKFFPELPYANITLRHLMHHTSGLPDYMDLFMKHWDSTQIATNGDMISMLVKHKPDTLFTPGSKWMYSNTGYALLASVIAKVSGQGFGEFLKQHIFEPLGMKRTLVYGKRYEKRLLDNYALGYVYDKYEKKYYLADDHPGLSAMVIMLDGVQGDGSVNSTTNDLLKWDRALYTEKLVPKEMLTEAFTPVETGAGRENYGFGWGLMDSKKYGKRVSHMGRWPGYTTFIDRHISNDKVFILLQNNGKDLPPPLDFILDIIYGLEPEKIEESKISVEEMQQYVGEFELAPGFLLKFFVKEGKLFVEATGQGAAEIFRQKGDLFFLKIVDAKLEFSRDDDNRVNAVTLFQNGQEIKGMKIK